MQTDGDPVEIMRDVSAMQACDGGFLVTDLFGRSEYIQGRIRYLDLMEDHIILLEKD
jgi:predicted RNA-binding protein